MTEKTRKMLVFATLPIAVVWAVFNFPTKKQAPVVSQPPVAPAALKAPAVPKAPVNAGLIDVEQMESEPWGSDPFHTNYAGSAVPDRPAAPQEWTLKGIVYAKDNPLAFINRQSVRVGDIVNDAEVVKINKNSVIIKHNDREITLTVNKG